MFYRTVAHRTIALRSKKKPRLFKASLKKKSRNDMVKMVKTYKKQTGLFKLYTYWEGRWGYVGVPKKVGADLKSHPLTLPCLVGLRQVSRTAGQKLLLLKLRALN